MKNKLLNIRLKSVNKKLNFDYNMYSKAVSVIVEDVLKKYNIKSEKIGILGLARGGLPLVVSVSHGVGIREISFLQLKMSNSDYCHDYGNVRYIGEYIQNDVEKFLLFEDIIYKGKTTDFAINILKEKGKKVLGVYALIADEGFEKIKIENEDVEINYVYEIESDDWVYFLWEKDVRGEKYEKYNF